MDADGQPTVDAVGFRFDRETGRFYVGGLNMAASRKYRNVAGGNHKVSMITDDLASTDPWRPRGIRVHATARTIQREGRSGPAPYLEITPTVSWSWSIEDRQDFKEGRFTPKRIAWRGVPQ